MLPQAQDERAQNLKRGQLNGERRGRFLVDEEIWRGGAWRWVDAPPLAGAQILTTGNTRQRI
jgi:hypothetical protein